MPGVFGRRKTVLKVKYADYMVKEDETRCIDRPNGSGDMLFLHFPRPMHIKTAEVETVTEKNACIIFAPDDMHAFRGAPEFVNSYVHFEGEDAALSAIPHGRLLYPGNIARLEEIMRKIRDELILPDEYSERASDLYLRELLLMLARGLTAPADDPLYEQLSRVRAKMLSEPNKNYSSLQLAEECYLSRTQFFEHYRRFFGSTPKHDMLKMKMEKARVLLSDSSKTVADVAEAVGFASVEHFTRYYKAYFSRSPRTKHQ